jgi:Zn ribbon nucleic-acid-binding protein
MTINELSRAVQPDIWKSDAYRLYIWKWEKQWLYALCEAEDGARLNAAKEVDPAAICLSAQNFNSNTLEYIKWQITRAYELNEREIAGVPYCPKCIGINLAAAREERGTMVRECLDCGNLVPDRGAWAQEVSQ